MPLLLPVRFQRVLHHAYTPYITATIFVLFLAILEDHTSLPSFYELSVTVVALFCGMVFVVAPAIYVLDWVKEVMESLEPVVVYYRKLREEEKKKNVADRPRTYGFEYSDDEGEEEVQQHAQVKLATTPKICIPASPVMSQYNTISPQDLSTASEPTPPKPSTNLKPRATSASPAGLSTAGHTPHPRPRPTWTPTNTPPPKAPSLSNPNPMLANPTTSSFPEPSSTAGHTLYPRLMAPPARPTTPPAPPSILRPHLLQPMPPTPHHASGLLGPSPAPKRALGHFSPEAIHADIAIREALFKKPGRPVTSEQGMFGSMTGMGMGLGESVGEAGLRRVRLRGGWRYVPIGEGGDGEVEGEVAEGEAVQKGNVFREMKERDEESENKRGKEKMMDGVDLID